MVEVQDQPDQLPPPLPPEKSRHPVLRLFFVLLAGLGLLLLVASGLCTLTVIAQAGGNAEDIMLVLGIGSSGMIPGALIWLLARWIARKC